jgi:hypothetical protein
VTFTPRKPRPPRQGFWELWRRADATAQHWENDSCEDRRDIIRARDAPMF